MVETEIIDKIKRFVEKLEKQKIKPIKVILYGSRACGKAHKDSDIDIAIVSSNFGKDRFEEGANLFEIACDIDPRIEPVPISLESYERDTWVPLIYEIKTKGVEIPINE